MLESLDLDGNGTLETQRIPLYDSTGNPVVLSGPAGQRVAASTLAPFGESWAVRVDSTPPAIEQVGVRADGMIQIELSESLDGNLEASIANSDIRLETQGQQAGGSSKVESHSAASTIPLTATRLVQLGRQARQRILLVPATPPTPGTQVTLHLAPAALADRFANQPPSVVSVSFEWPEPGSAIVEQDTTPPRVELVVVEAGKLEIQLSETPAESTVPGAILIDGGPTTWTLLEDGYTLRSGATLAAGQHTVAISTALEDLAGLPLAGPFSETFTVSAVPGGGLLVFEAPDPNVVPPEAIAAVQALHGLPWDGETGLLYFRNRYYDPEMGRFVTADPPGFGDGPSPYSFAMSSSACLEAATTSTRHTPSDARHGALRRRLRCHVLGSKQSGSRFDRDDRARPPTDTALRLQGSDASTAETTPDPWGPDPSRMNAPLRLRDRGEDGRSRRR